MSKADRKNIRACSGLALFGIIPVALAFSAGLGATEGQAASEPARRWLDGDERAPTSVVLPPATHRAVELTGEASRLNQDPVTGLWGVPVTRRGDPDFAPENPKHSDDIPSGPLTLPARIFAPDGIIDRGVPCVVTTNGYGIGIPGGAGVGSNLGPGFGPQLMTPFAERGYLAVMVALRQSPLDPMDRQVGINDYSRFYGADGVDIINWVVGRYGCGMINGDPATAKVGMLGASLLGGSQWAVLKQPDVPASLKAIAPDVAGATTYSVWFPGGMLPGPGRIARVGKEFAFVFPQHRDFDEYWRGRQMSQLDLSGAASRRIAVLVTGGWEDYITPGAVDTFMAYRALSGPTHKKLFIGPTGHPTPLETYVPLAVNWMDRWLRGIDNGIERDPVTIYIQGANRWRAEASWPIADAANTRLYLHGAVAKSNQAGSLRVAPPASADPPAAFRYDPERGPFLRTMLASGPEANARKARRLSLDLTPFERVIPNWTSAAFAEPTEITGSIALIFWASSSTSDADFVASLTDVEPNGVSRSVVSGYLNGPRQHYLGVDAEMSPPRLLVPDEPRKFTLIFPPTSYVFAKGHRLRIAVAGGSDVAVEQNGLPQSGPQGPGKNPRPFAVQIFQSLERPSYLDIPIVDAPQP